ncbi:DUF2637 domain-containing protein [Pseudonocardia sp. T1-2H]|uniref:DUF2637 domain-containing protein n=1 Tax=Pseudonocardia sp. T1-2H TaxID=3128899 RepID=UPI00310144A9
MSWSKVRTAIRAAWCWVVDSTPLVVSLVAVAGVAAWMSFDAIAALAVRCGMNPATAWRVPVLIDVGAFGGTVAWRSRRLDPERVEFGRKLALVLLGVSMIANGVEHGAEGIERQVAFGWVVATILLSLLAPPILAAMLHLATSPRPRLAAGAKAGAGELAAAGAGELATAGAEDLAPAGADELVPAGAEDLVPAGAGAGAAGAAGAGAAGEDQLAAGAGAGAPAGAGAGAPGAGDWRQEDQEDERQEDQEDQPADEDDERQDDEEPPAEPASDDFLLHRAARLVAEGAGRPTLMRELGVKDHVAKKLLKEIDRRGLAKKRGA